MTSKLKVDIPSIQALQDLFHDILDDRASVSSMIFDVLGVCNPEKVRIIKSICDVSNAEKTYFCLLLHSSCLLN